MSKENEDAETCDAEARDGSQPGIELLGHDVTGRVKSNRTQQEHSRSMRRGNDEAEQNGVPGGAARSNQISSHDGLAVSRLERVKRAKTRREQRRREQEPEAQPAPARDEIGEAAARRILHPRHR